MAQKKSGKDRSDQQPADKVSKKAVANKAVAKKAATKKAAAKKVSPKKDLAKAELSKRTAVGQPALSTSKIAEATRPADTAAVEPGDVPPPLPAPRPSSGRSGRSTRKGTGGRSTATTARAVFRVPSGASTADLPTDRFDHGPDDEKSAVKATEELAKKLSRFQERLQAQGAEGNNERVLLILQGMDTSGKDGVTKTVFDATNPLGLHLASFKKPTAEELAHDFLWRIGKQVPEAGKIGVFNRSQYEDVLVVRVHELVPRAEWTSRFAAINAFERTLTRQGVTVVKCFLHVSKQVQKERLAARLDDPEKWWKYNPGDIDERAHWDDYQQAYGDVLRRCNTVGAPWYVIPADHKWYRNWAVAALLTEVLADLDPQFPPAGFDVAGEKARLALA